MSASPPFATRPLQPVDVPEALALARGAGAVGVYLANVLHAHPQLGPEAELIGFYGAEELLGLAYFGLRGNLVLVLAVDLDPQRCARSLLAQASTWRIVLGPTPVVAALRELGRLQVLVDRPQVYYSCLPEEVVTTRVDPSLRQARKKDLKVLMSMALELNRSDLGVDPWRVDRGWLKQNTSQRIREQSTYVLGDPVQVKLDLGSTGPAGVVLEGVFTQEDCRGRGLATQLVASVIAAQGERGVPCCLHVAADNQPARRAYASAGMREVARCQLLVRS